jgi:hypothetical protein
MPIAIHNQCLTTVTPEKAEKKAGWKKESEAGR